ncbi:unnamed protein product [Cladocopium goreaui]|uniref:Uncharacterized protein n=1 Tax=Cladocopium goreaui TaxID=2562237 RepID=A0A9P1GMH5_9DINO|nr:unnamed protein product [Cladocopium goreaui]
MAVEDQQLIADAQNEERSAGGWRRASGPLVLGLLGSNLLLLCMVLWLAIAPGAGSPSADGPKDRDLMLPLHSEFRREQQEQRHLFDVNLFDEPDEPYEDYPTENSIVKTTCVIDAVQAATYLGKAVVNIYRAEICPDDEPLGCTAPVAHAITSILWLTAFLTSASSTCAATISQGGSCAAAILRDLATAGSTIYGFDEDCYLTKPRETSWRVYPRWYQHLLPEPEERRLRSTRGAQNLTAYRAKSAEIAAKLRNLTAPSAGGRAMLPNVLFDAESKGLPRDLVSKLQKVRAVDAKHNYNTERNFALANCVFDSVAATTWMMRALLSIEEASRNCPEPKACTVDVLYVLGSFSYAAQTLSLAFVDCPKRGKREALCGADISDVVGSMAIFVASTLQAAEYCDATFRAPTGPIRGGLRSAAGA